MPLALKTVLEKLKPLDRFGFHPTLRFVDENAEGEKQIIGDDESDPQIPVRGGIVTKIRRLLPCFGDDNEPAAPSSYTEISRRGLMGSLILIAIMLAYVVMTIVRFFTEDPSISLVDSPTSPILQPFPPFGITFRRNAGAGSSDAAKHDMDVDFLTSHDGRPLHHFHNESYFRVWFAQYAVQQQDLFPRRLTILGQTLCDFSSWAGWSGNTTVCPIRPASIGGRYQSNQYTFLVAHIATCDPTAPFVKDYDATVTQQYERMAAEMPPPSSSAADKSAFFARLNNFTFNTSAESVVKCAPQAEIDALLSNGRFNMVVNYPTLNENQGQFESNWFLYNPLLRTSFEGIYHTLKVVTTPDLLTNFFSSEKFLLRPTAGAERSLLSPFVTASAANGGGRIVLSIYARMDSTDVLETRRRETSLDLIGTWAALYGALFAFFGLYFLGVNEEKFYRKFPQWGRVGREPFGPRNDNGQTNLTEMSSVKRGGENGDLFVPLVSS